MADFSVLSVAKAVAVTNWSLGALTSMNFFTTAGLKYK